MRSSRFNEALSPAFAIETERSHRAFIPHSVLLFPILFHNLVWVKHPVRGWEVPGGKVEPGESPEDAVRREAFEEAGLRIGRLTWVAQYRFRTESGSKAKWVYVGDVQDVSARPAGSEIVDVRMFHPVLTPEDARTRPDVSPIMKDDVYLRTWTSVLSEMQCGRP